MRMWHRTMLVVVLVMLLTPWEAWSRVLVLEDFEGAGFSFDWYDGGASYLGQSEDTPSPDSLLSVGVGFYPDGWHDYVGLELEGGPVDVSSYSYMNFYIRFAPEYHHFWGVQFGSNNWYDVDNTAFVDPMPDVWKYHSVRLTLTAEYIGDGVDWSALSAVAFWFETFEDTEAVYIDHITVSDTWEEAMLTGPELETRVRISGAHTLDVGDALELVATAEGFDEGTETYAWSKDGAPLAAATDTLTIDPVEADHSGLYEVTVGGLVDGVAAEPIQASFTLWVGVATPLAGGLGLALLAGACALAGAISISRRK